MMSACGGGGGVNNFVDNVVSELDGSGSTAQSYYSNISSLNSILSQLAGVGSLQLDLAIIEVL